MMKKSFSPAVTFFTCLLLAFSLIFISSCKKSSSENTADNPGANVSTEMVPITIELPSAMFVGTPQDIRVTNLEKPLGKPRPPFLAPAGTENVALGKPVTSSDNFPIIGELSYVTDGEKEASDGFYVELAPMKQYITIDLEAEYVGNNSAPGR